MHDVTTRPRIAGAVFCFALLGAGFTACADQETGTAPARTDSPTSALCEDVEALRGSVRQLQDVKIGEDALPTLSTELKAIQTELQQLPANASTEYSTEVRAVKSAAAALESSIQGAATSPSAAAVAAVGDDVGALGASVRGLSEAVSDTC